MLAATFPLAVLPIPANHRSAPLPRPIAIAIAIAAFKRLKITRAICASNLVRVFDGLVRVRAAGALEINKSTRCSLPSPKQVLGLTYPCRTATSERPAHDAERFLVRVGVIVSDGVQAASAEGT